MSVHISNKLFALKSPQTHRLINLVSFSLGSRRYNENVLKLEVRTAAVEELL